MDALRHDPAFKMAVGRTPEAKLGLASQPTMNAGRPPDLRAVIKLSYALIDLYCGNYDAPPASKITLDIDDTFDAAHGEQQLAFWNGFHGERGFSPIHVYEAETERPVAFLLRPAKTQMRARRGAGAYCAGWFAAFGIAWLNTRILLRGDSRYARLNLWTGARPPSTAFGMPMNAALKRDRIIVAAADARCVRAQKSLPTHRVRRNVYAAVMGRKRGVVAASTTTLGMDIRAIVTSLAGSTPEQLCSSLCAWTGREPHQTPQDPIEERLRLAPRRWPSDRANPAPLIGYSGRCVAPSRARRFAKAEFATLQLRLVKSPPASLKPPRASG